MKDFALRSAQISQMYLNLYNKSALRTDFAVQMQTRLNVLHFALAPILHQLLYPILEWAYLLVACLELKTRKL